MTLPSLTGWQAESIRVSCFAPEPIDANGKNWWQLAVGDMPESIISKPQLAEHKESGPFKNGVLEVKVAFNRVDWIYSPDPVADVFPPSIGEASAVIENIIEPVSNWFEKVNKGFVRLAFGSVFLRRVEDVASGNRVMLDYLPFLQVDPDLANDLSSQVNYPATSSVVDGLRIHRVNRFMSVMAQVITVGPDQPVPMIQPQYFCRAELDFNTAPERNEPIPSDKFVGVLQELLVLSKDMMAEGVKP